MASGKAKVVQPSEQERGAINTREQMELARRIQMTEDQERRMNALQRGGRKLLMFNSFMGAKEKPAAPAGLAATMGVRS